MKTTRPLALGELILATDTVQGPNGFVWSAHNSHGRRVQPHDICTYLRRV